MAINNFEISLSLFTYTDSPLLCSAHLINSGVSISGSTVTAEFAGLGPIRYYQCSLDSNRPHLCELLYICTRVKVLSI